MRVNYFTSIKASERIWREQLKKQITNSEELWVTHWEEDQINLGGYHCIEDQEIINLSLQYPEQVFEVGFASDDPYDNRVLRYQFLSGESKFISEGYEHLFCIRKADQEKLDPELYERFKALVIDYFTRADNLRTRTSVSDPSFSEMPVVFNHGENKLVPTLEYSEGDFILRATKHGLTYIDVSIDIKKDAGKNYCMKEEDQWKE